jgi:hypothetical protein
MLIQLQEFLGVHCVLTFGSLELQSAEFGVPDGITYSDGFTIEQLTHDSTF